MTLKKKILKLIKGEAPLVDVLHYIVGNLRYKLFYSKYDFLIREHIRQQIDFRIKVMNPTCYEQGSCVACGCETTELQMANKSCNNYCYPRMLSKREWKSWQQGHVTIENRSKGYFWIKRKGDVRYRLYKPTKYGYVPFNREESRSDK